MSRLNPEELIARASREAASQRAAQHRSTVLVILILASAVLLGFLAMSWLADNTVGLLVSLAALLFIWVEYVRAPEPRADALWLRFVFPAAVLFLALQRWLET